MNRPICTKENPAPATTGFNSGVNHSRNWNNAFEHPDATSKEINSDHGDERVTCPHCGQSYISEGIDA